MNLEKREKKKRKTDGADCTDEAGGSPADRVGYKVGSSRQYRPLLEPA
jgi:hypothetical protein